VRRHDGGRAVGDAAWLWFVRAPAAVVRGWGRGRPARPCAEYRGGDSDLLVARLRLRPSPRSPPRGVVELLGDVQGAGDSSVRVVRFVGLPAPGGRLVRFRA